MAVPYENLRNSVTSPPSWYAKLKPYEILDMDGMASAVNQKNPTYTPSLVKQVTTLFLAEVITQLLNGKFVTLEGQMAFKLTCRGNLPDATSAPDVNNTDIAITASVPVRDRLRSEVVYTALPVTEKVPNIEFEQDTGTTITDFIVDGGSMILTGQNLKFNQAAIDEGVFVVNTLEDVENKSTLVAWNKDRRIIATPVLDTSVPSSNEHRVEVRARYTSTGSLRTGTYSKYLRSTLTASIVGDYPVVCFNGITA